MKNAGAASGWYTMAKDSLRQSQDTAVWDNSYEEDKS